MEFDLVIKTARNRQLQRKVIFGTTALHLLRKCPCPVWVVDPEGSKRRGGVLAAIDTQAEDPVEQALNTKFMELSTSLSILEQSPLPLVHAWNAPYPSLDRQSPFLKIKLDEVDAYIRILKERHHGPFAEMLEHFKAVVPETIPHFIKGPADEVIPELSKELQTDVILMATLARTGIPGMFIGNTAESVITEVDCSVLAIEPGDLSVRFGFEGGLIAVMVGELDLQRSVVEEFGRS